MVEHQMESQPKQCPVPSQAQLALAIAIVNSKPASISVIDHIQQIRHHIKASGKSYPSPSSSSDKYFDSVAFWKQAYTKAEATQSKLSDRIYELEQRVETLKLKVKQEDNSCDTPERGKRKASKEPTEPDLQRKREKTSSLPSGLELNGEADLEWLNKLVIRENLTESRINSAMRHMSALQQNLQKKRPNWPAIYSTALDLCTAICSIVLCLHESLDSKPKDSSSAKNKASSPKAIVILALIESAHTVLCRALNKIMNSPESPKYEGQLIYHLSRLFETVLRALAKICEHQACSKVHSEIKQVSKSSPKNSPEKQHPVKNSDIVHNEVSTDEILLVLKRVLAGMMLKTTTLITARPNSLFEGYLYVFVSRVGTVLSVLEFKDIVINPDLQTSSEKLPLPDSLRHAGIEKSENIGATMRAYETESYHLGWLLEKVVALVHSISMKSSLNQGNTGTGKDHSASIFLGFSKRKLQNTLLKSVFGEEESLFLESLWRPQNLEVEVQSGNTSEPASEWFSREVWRLLGWDILESIWADGNENHMK